MSRQLVTIFDVHDVDWSMAFMPLMGLFGVFLAQRRIRIPQVPALQGSERAISWFVLVFVILWTVVAGYANWNAIVTLPNRLDSGQHETSKGPITKLVLEPWKGYGSVIFTVGHHRFSRFDYDMTSKDNVIIRAGCMSEGKWAEVDHIGKTILRIRVAADPANPQQKCRGRIH